MSARIMNRSSLLSLTAAVVAVIGLSGSVAQAQDCGPGAVEEYLSNQPAYDALAAKLLPAVGTLTTNLDNVVNQATYATLLTQANTIAASLTNGRLLIALPDGTVVVDTSKANNTYANFLAKAINENHNTRAAVISAQLFKCGYGVERKFSTSTSSFETYFAARLGGQFDSAGTARLSVK